MREAPKERSSWRPKIHPHDTEETLHIEFLGISEGAEEREDFLGTWHGKRFNLQIIKLAAAARRPAGRIVLL